MIDRSLPYQTLHAHTNQSDGVMNYSQVLDLCEQNQIGVVAFTDHDVVPNESDLAKIAQLKNHAVKYVIGIELSSVVKDESGQEIHIIGLFIDPTNNRLVNYTHQLEESRLDRARMIASNLQKLGFSVTFDEVLKEKTGRSIGQPHVVKAVLKKPENLRKLEAIEKDFLNQPQTPEFLTLAKQLSVSDTWQKFFTLVFSGKTMIKEVVPSFSHKYMLDIEQSTSLIREAGGIAIFAHWTFDKSDVDSQALESYIQKGFFDGIETTYGFGKIGNLRQEINDDINFLEQLAKRYDLVRGGGGDFHTAEDFSLMKEETIFAQKTQGMVEAILEKRKVDLTWSSLRE